MKKVVITGAGGFIGRSLSLKLAEKDILVYAILLNETEAERMPKHKNIIPVIGDLIDYKSFMKQIDVSVDVFYHLAWKGISSADYKNINIQKENFEISINASYLAKVCGSKKFVFVGSNQEYLMAKSKIDGSLSKASIYGVCKLCAREICHTLLKDEMEFVATVFTNIFGVGDYSKRTANLFIHKLINGESLDLIEGNNLYDWTYIDDAVAGLIAVGEKGFNGKQYYIGSRTLRTFKEIITDVRDIVAPNGKLYFGKFIDNTYTDYSILNLDELYLDTGFECTVDFNESIIKTAEWTKTLPWEEK